MQYYRMLDLRAFVDFIQYQFSSKTKWVFTLTSDYSRNLAKLNRLASLSGLKGEVVISHTIYLFDA